ncbi:hypothetical protein RvY_09388-2 [Ramazzottius varieornatus]|uniref:Uncharacterized protein n=1 Tax=Ramazzottius varieornatus TaxID=947166 RepID=A0A1D1VDR9_RAMVA|nr:hypothetical protein RvY_09388-2 [Ramazzottius varieornatus]
MHGDRLAPSVYLMMLTMLTFDDQFNLFVACTNRGKLSGFAPRFDEGGPDYTDAPDDRRVNPANLQDQFARKFAEHDRSPSNPPGSEEARRSPASPEQKLKKQALSVNHDGQNIFMTTKNVPTGNGTDWFFDKPLIQHLPGLKERSPASVHDTHTEPLSFLRNLARDSMAVKSDGIAQKPSFPFYKPVPQMHPGIINTGNLDFNDVIRMNSILQNSKSLFSNPSVSQASAFYHLPPFSSVSIPAPSGTSDSSDTPVLGTSPKQVYSGSPATVPPKIKDPDTPLDLSGGLSERNEEVLRSRKPKNPPPVRITEGVFGKRRRLEDDAYGTPSASVNTEVTSFRPKKLRHLYHKEAYSPLQSVSNSPLNIQSPESNVEVQGRRNEDAESRTSDELLERPRSI